MNCMKCGRDIPEEQVFCDDCLAVMERYPVRPGTVIHLPKHNHPPAYHTPTIHSTRTPEDIIAGQRKTIRLLGFAVTVLALLLAATAVLALYLLESGGNLVFPFF